MTHCYIIVNDKAEPWHYYCGQGFLREVDTTVERGAAKRFASLRAANDVISRNPDRGYLYAAGWRVVPDGGDR